MDISVLSILVAGAAVIVSPGVSWLIVDRQLRAAAETTDRQLRAAVKTADQQITAPMRQEWINKLRELLAEFTANTAHGLAADGVGERTDKNNTRLFLLLAHIQLMLNPNEDDHRRLEGLMRKVVGEILDNKGNLNELSDLRDELIALSRKILKREWNRVKEPIQE